MLCNVQQTSIDIPLQRGIFGQVHFKIGEGNNCITNDPNIVICIRDDYIAILPINKSYIITFVGKVAIANYIESFKMNIKDNNSNINITRTYPDLANYLDFSLTYDNKAVEFSLIPNIFTQIRFFTSNIYSLESNTEKISLIYKPLD
ncbi:MAG: hypothetical protein QW478_01165 [Candidatus Micrarchaeaceae archaeon]